MNKMESPDYQDIPMCPVGSQYQAEIPSLTTEDKRHELITSPFHGYGYPFLVGLAIPITWTSLGEVDKKEEETQESINFTSNKMKEQRELKQVDPLPFSPLAIWSDIEMELFLLGLYIFGKEPNLLSRFLGTKTVGDVLSYYYGKFYRKDGYKRWTDSIKRKPMGRFPGKYIFHGSRLPDLLSRLKSKLPNEAHDTLIEVFNSFNCNQTSFEDFVIALKSTVGAEVFVDAIGIGKEKRDLSFIRRQCKPSNTGLSIGKDSSLLSSVEIVKLLTSCLRRSKVRSDDIFWEVVWPRLLAKGWHSEQPEDVRKTKNCLVFIVPGIAKFSRSELCKGTHYFDSINDIIKKVVADPVLLELKMDEINNTFPSEKNEYIMDMKVNQGSTLGGHQELPKFTIIDTSLVDGEEPFKVREQRNLPVNAKINFTYSDHLSDMAIGRSSKDPDASDELSYDHGDSKATAADASDSFQIKTVTSSTREKPKKKIAAKNSLADDGPNERISMVKLLEDKIYDCMEEKQAPVHSKTTIDEIKFVKKRAHIDSTINLNKQKTLDDEKTGGSIHIATSGNHGEMKAGEAPLISSTMANDPLEEIGKRSVSLQTEVANFRKHGTRNRPPTAKALEAIASGFLGSGKRKGGPRNIVTNHPSQRARKTTCCLDSNSASNDVEKSMGATKRSISVAASGAEMSRVDAKAQQ